MIIDVHGHVSAPDALYAYKANVLSHRGAHGRGRVTATDDQLREAVEQPGGAFGISHLEHLDTAGIDVQLISPRPYTMMHSEEPARIEYNSKIADRIAGHCAPQKVTLGQIADIVCRHLTAHPETRQMSATDLVTESFVKAFPCGPPNRK